MPLRELICGYGEILKHSLIADKKFFLFLDKNRSKILSLDNSYIIKAIYKSCLIKKRIVESDEKESSLRKILILAILLHMHMRQLLIIQKNLIMVKQLYWELR